LTDVLLTAARAKAVGEWQTGKTAGMSGVASVEEDIYAVKDAIEVSGEAILFSLFAVQPATICSCLNVLG